MAEVDAFFLSADAEKEEGNNGQKNTYPLVYVQLFAEDEHGTDENHYRTCRIDGADDGDGQMFHCEVSENPRREDNATLQYDELMDFPCDGYL